MIRRFKSSSLTWLLFAVVILLSVFAVWLFFQNAGTVVPASWGTDGGDRSDILQVINAVQQLMITPVIMSALAALILSRQPGNRIGRLLMLLGVLSMGAFLLAEWAVYGAYTVAQPIPGTDLAAWITNWVWIYLFAPLLLMGALFPDGRFLSRRWAWLIVACLAWFTVPMTIGAMIEGAMSSAYQIQNPFVTGDNTQLYDFLFSFGVFGMPASMIAVLAAAGARFRRSTGKARQQMKWLLSGVVIMALMTLVGLGISFGLNSRLGDLLVNAAILGPVLGVSVALLRHRLYDIDVLLRRTLVYSILTALLAAVYFTGIIGLQALFQGLTGNRESPLVTVITTLVIAALFNPLRTRIQDGIDRRFYRAKYDAERTIEEFSAATRDEVDLERLSYALVAVVSETMQPEQIHLQLSDPLDTH